MNNSDIDTERCGIYYIQGYKGENKAKIVPVCVVDMYDGQQIPDKLLKKINLFDNVVAEIYECNILNKFLLTTKKLPVMYVRVIIDRTFKKIRLARFTLYFTITSDVRSEKELINSPLNGKFSLELKFDAESEVTSLSVKKYPGNQDMIDHLVSIIRRDNIMDYLKRAHKFSVDKLKEKFESEYDTTPPVPSTFLDSNLK